MALAAPFQFASESRIQLRARLRRLRRRILPNGLFGRFMLIVILPLLLTQAVLAHYFFTRHWDSVSRWLASGVVGEVALLVELIEAAEDTATRHAVLDLGRAHFRFALSLQPDGDLNEAVSRTRIGLQSRIDRGLYERLDDELDRRFAVDTRRTDQRQVIVYVQTEAGLLRVLTTRKRIDSGTVRDFTVWMVSVSFILAAIAVYFLTRQLRPIRRLAFAADAFGRGLDSGNVKLEGATEIRQASSAFNVMRHRLARHLQARTEMLAAVSHDLRTPLTRMKLELAMMPEDEPSRGALTEDVEEMQRLVEAYLTFARGEQQENAQLVDLSALLAEVTDKARRNNTPYQAAVARRADPIYVTLRPIALRRCLSNLLDNAARHARHIEVSAEEQADRVIVRVDDDGPGIPLEARERAFAAFQRLDGGARQPGKGGTGLGLTIARDVVFAHGGTIHLLDSPLGGLRVEIRLPL